MLSSIHCHSISNSQVMEAIKMSINRGMDEDVVPIYHRILLSQRKEGNNAICSNMDGPRNCHNEWMKTERQMVYDIAYMWDLEKELIYKTEVDSQIYKTN